MNQQKIGKSMIIIGWVALLGVLVTVFGFIEGKRDNPNQKPESISDTEKIVVRLAGTSKGHYVATGRINNRTVDFLVDTGATYVAIPKNLATELNLPLGRKTQVNTANGLSDAWHTKLRTLIVGDIVLREIDALISPGLDGKILLGMSALRNLDFRQEGNELVLTQYREAR